MEEVKVLMEFISTIGFPAFFCFYIANQGKEDRKSYQKTIEKLTETVDKNSGLIQALSDKIEYFFRGKGGS